MGREFAPRFRSGAQRNARLRDFHRCREILRTDRGARGKTRSSLPGNNPQQPARGLAWSERNFSDQRRVARQASRARKSGVVSRVMVRRSLSAAASGGPVQAFGAGEDLDRPSVDRNHFDYGRKFRQDGGLRDRSTLNIWA